MKTMQISRDDAVTICLAMGFATCTKWDKARMNRKMKEISDMDPDALEIDDESIGDPKERKRIDKLLVEMGKAEEIEVVKEITDDADDTPADDADVDDTLADDSADDSETVEDAAEEAEAESDGKKGKKAKKNKKAEKAKKAKKSKEPKEKKVTKKSVVIKMLQRKGGATLAEMGEAITKACDDKDTEKNTKTAGLWIRKIGFEVEFDKESKKYQAKG